MKEHDIVRLKRDVNHIKAGTKGTVVHVYPSKNVFEVEFNVSTKPVIFTLNLFELDHVAKSSSILAKQYALAQCGIEMVGPMILGLFLDKYFHTTPWMVSILAICGFILGLTHIVLISNQIEKQQNG